MGKKQSKTKLVTMVFVAMLFLSPMVIAMPFQAWPDSTLYVYDNNSGHHDYLTEAMKIWNKSQNAVHIKFTKQKKQANVIVDSVITPQDLDKLCKPLKTINPFSYKKRFVACVDWQGYKIGSPTRMGLLEGNSNTAIAVHELGHVLGLGHTHSTCSVMVPNFEENLEHNCTGETMKSRVCSKQEKCLKETTVYRKCGPTLEDLKQFQVVYPGARIKPSPECEIKFSDDKLESSYLRFDRGMNPNDAFRYAEAYNNLYLEKIPEKQRKLLATMSRLNRKYPLGNRRMH